MTGVTVNFAAIIAGGAFGLFIKKRLGERHKGIMTHAMALAVVFVGISGAVSGLLDEKANPLLFIISLAAGGLIGETLDIDKGFNRLGAFIQGRFAKDESMLSQGFVTASLLFCIGTMAVVGSIESGIMGRHDILLAKSVIDGITSIVLGATFGAGVILSAFSVLLYQGALTVAAGFAQPYITEDMLREISIVGGILIFTIGTNMLGVTKIKLANFLPAIFIPVIYYAIINLTG